MKKKKKKKDTSCQFLYHFVWKTFYDKQTLEMFLVFQPMIICFFLDHV